MSPPENSSASTSTTLLRRVQLHEPAAWRQLVTLYGPLIYRWARKTGLQDSDAGDIVQNVFCSVVSNLDGFRRDGSFRGWLWVITRNHVRKLVGRNDREPSTLAFESELLQRDWNQRDDQALDWEQRALAHRAMLIIRSEFEERTWKAFLRVAVDRQAAADVAQELDMNVGAVRQAKYRVLCRLRELLIEA